VLPNLLVSRGVTACSCLHKPSVIAAYGGRCAVIGLPEPLLHDANHIVADTDEQFGQSAIRKGIPVSKIHHAIFDPYRPGLPHFGATPDAKRRSDA